MIRRSHFAIVVFLCISAAAPVHAQSLPDVRSAPPQMEAMLGYSAVRGSGSTGAFWMVGGKAEFSVAVTRNFSATYEVAGHHASNINSAGEDIGLVSYLFGPRYSYRRYRRFTPFAQGLFGGVHGFDAYFPNANGSGITQDAFAMSAGGGININLSRHIAVRPVQADYFLTMLPNNGSNHENSLRLGAGIVFLIGNPNK